MYIYLAVAILAVASLMFHFLATHRAGRWLPERSGPAIVLENLSKPGATGTRYTLRVRVLVPPASPEEARLLAADEPDRDELLGARGLEDTVETPVEDWNTVEPGARLRASYQINIERTRIIVRALYLDHLDPSPRAEPGRSALP
jgi:hypothetical protein